MKLSRVSLQKDFASRAARLKVIPRILTLGLKPLLHVITIVKDVLFQSILNVTMKFSIKIRK